jgi:hypothetical protein
MNFVLTTYVVRGTYDVTVLPLKPSDHRNDVAQQANERPRHWLEAFGTRPRYSKY